MNTKNISASKAFIIHDNDATGKMVEIAHLYYRFWDKSDVDKLAASTDNLTKSKMKILEIHKHICKLPNVKRIIEIEDVWVDPLYDHVEYLNMLSKEIINTFPVRRYLYYIDYMLSEEESFYGNNRCELKEKILDILTQYIERLRNYLLKPRIDRKQSCQCGFIIDEDKIDEICDWCNSKVIKLI